MAKRILFTVVVFTVAVAAAAQDRNKVNVCHFSGADAQLLSIARNALPAHLKHGDIEAPASVKTGADCLVPQPASAPAVVTVTADARGSALFPIPATNVMARVNAVDSAGAPVAGAEIQLIVIGGDFLVIADDPGGRLAPGVTDGKLSDARPGSALQVAVTVTLQQPQMPPPPFVVNHFVLRDECFTKEEFRAYLETSCVQTLQLGRKTFLRWESSGNWFVRQADKLAGKAIDAVCADYAREAADEAFANRTLPRKVRVYSPPSTISPKVMPFYATDFGDCGGSCCDGKNCRLVSKPGDCTGKFRALTPCSPDHPCVVGACCDGTGCMEISPEQCVARGGRYRGDDVPCSPDPCKEGACCVQKVCAVGWELECLAQNGRFLGNKTVCDGNPCRRGACCDASGCAIELASDCEKRGGKYQGDDTTCSPDPCDKGACCDPRTGCTVVSSIECEKRGGRFHGRDTTCDRIPGTTTFRTTLSSGGGLGGAGFPIPFTHGDIKTTVTVPGNIINGQCVRDWRVEVRVCPFNAGCQGGTFYAGQHFSICHANPETIVFPPQLNPGIPCSYYSVNALTGGVSTVEVEIVP